jgi:sec-independent protein translocase protein TatC
MAQDAMTLREHLDELRKRLMWSVVFLALAVGASFVFRDYLLEFLLDPGYGGTGEVPIATEVLETLGVVFKVTLMAGFVVALPLVLYQVIMFVSPGLTTRERVYMWVFLPAVIVAFVGGSAFAYYVIFPPAFEFLSDFGGEYVNEEFRTSSYINTILSLMFWMGIVFQIPIVLFALARFGVVTPRWLARFRRFFVVIAFVAAAIITPTFDPVNQSLVAVPIIVLYEFGILLARLGQRLRQGAEEYETIDHSRPFFLKRWLGTACRPFRVLRFWRWRWRFWRRTE